MYVIAFMIFIITAIVIIAHILFDIGGISEGFEWFVKNSSFLFWASLLFFVVKKETKKKNRV
ncbi:hypothetical protein J14TS5_55780 [Paenibacillus lautus]|nr:hypothetical protein J14TS5_55780 [Paenibacillus lautus]